MQICRCTDIQIYRYTDIQIYRYTGIQIYIYTDILIYRYTDIQIYRYTDIQIYRNTDIQEYRYKLTERTLPVIIKNICLGSYACVILIYFSGSDYVCMLQQHVLHQAIFVLGWVNMNVKVQLSQTSP